MNFKGIIETQLKKYADREGRKISKELNRKVWWRRPEEEMQVEIDRIIRNEVVSQIHRSDIDINKFLLGLRKEQSERLMKIETDIYALYKLIDKLK